MTGGRSCPATGAEGAFDAPTRTIHLAILGIAAVVSAVVHSLAGKPIWRRMAFGALRKEALR
jgi:hypothetical protein